MEEKAVTTVSDSDPIYHAKKNGGSAFAASDVLFNVLRDIVENKIKHNTGNIWMAKIQMLMLIFNTNYLS
jgi:hypothetical protein